MPALITHYLAASRAAEQLKSKGVELNRAMFLWGAQGPDFFYYHKPLNGRKSLKDLGGRLHKMEPEKLFLALRDYSEQCGLREVNFVYSYCFGVLCHLALDSAAHPFVYYHQDVLAEKLGEKPRFMHHKIEHNLDVIMLKGLEDRSVTKFRIREALPFCPKGLKAASKAMAYAINEVCPDTPVTSKEIYSAFRDHKKYENLLLSRHGRRRAIANWVEQKKQLGVSLSCFVRPEEPEKDFDYVNSSGKRWRNNGLAGGRPSSQNFLQLFDTAVEKSVYLAERFKDCADHRQPLYFLTEYRFDNGNTKLEVRQWNE